MKANELKLGKRLFVSIGNSPVTNAIVTCLKSLGEDRMEITISIPNFGDGHVYVAEDQDLDTPVDISGDFFKGKCSSSFNAVKEDSVRSLREWRDINTAELNKRIEEMEQQQESDL